MNTKQSECIVWKNQNGNTKPAYIKPTTRKRSAKNNENSNNKSTKKMIKKKNPDRLSQGPNNKYTCTQMRLSVISQKSLTLYC